MDVPDKSMIENTQEPVSFSAFQSSFFNSSFEPESLEDFDFESAPMTHMNQTQHINDEDDPIPHSSGVTSHSNFASSYASTAPILNHHQPPPPPPPPLTFENSEAYCLKTIKDKSQETPSPTIEQSQYIIREQPYRNYQIFPGHTRFLLGGRLVTSGDYRAFIAGLVLLITPTVLFAVFTCPFLWHEVHPAIPIVFAYLFILAFVSMLKTSWTDPGIIPRNLDPVFDDGSASLELEASPKEIWIKNTPYSLTYCDTCKIYRPPRSSHCRQCDNCVEFEDHHCAWLNNCIGKRNYRSFFTFIMAAALSCIFVIVTCTYELVYYSKQESAFSFVFSKAPVSFVLCIYCFILLWLVGGLTLYHCSLILRGVTTHEQIRAEIIKAKYPELGANPYNKHHPFKNMIQVLCQPQPKSYLRRRKMADPIIEKI